MNIFKYSRGHFFGTLLPGAFLLLNVLFIYPSIFQSIPLLCKLNFKDDQLTYLTAGFIISYVFGVALRLMSPNILERLALTVRIPKSLIMMLYEKIHDKIKISTICKKSKTLLQYNNIIDKVTRLTFCDRFIIAILIYPYSKWFFAIYLPKSTKQHRDFYEKLLKEELQEKTKLLDRNFINSCKTYIYKNSDGLSEEIMYHEGLIRFICGIIYSLLIVLIILLFHFLDFIGLFFTYLIILIVFLDSLRRIRVKEVISIVDGYMFLKKSERINSC